MEQGYSTIRFGLFYHAYLTVYIQKWVQEGNSDIPRADRRPLSSLSQSIKVSGRWIGVLMILLMCRADQNPSSVRLVSEGSQEMFLEYAHYLPERAVTAVVTKLRELVSEELKDVELKAVLDFQSVTEHATSINEGMFVWPEDTHLHPIFSSSSHLCSIRQYSWYHEYRPRGHCCKSRCTWLAYNEVSVGTSQLYLYAQKRSYTKGKLHIHVFNSSGGYSILIVACMPSDILSRMLTGCLECYPTSLYLALYRSSCLGYCSSSVFFMPTAFEEWAVEESWAQLALPTEQEAAEYFASFRPSSSSSLDETPSTSADSNVVQGMIEELHMVMKSARFSATVLVSMTPWPQPHPYFTLM